MFSPNMTLQEFCDKTGISLDELEMNYNSRVEDDFEDDSDFEDVINSNISPELLEKEEMPSSGVFRLAEQFEFLAKRG